MKLSEAIRVGALLHPQAFGNIEDTVVVEEKVGWFRKRLKREKRTCAMGAAIEAQGCGFKVGSSSGGVAFRGESTSEGAQASILDAPPEWPLSYYHDCPQCESKSPDGDRFVLAQLIPHLNDDHRWTREQIAYLVGRFEDELAKPSLETETEKLIREQRAQLEAMRELRMEEMRRQSELQARRQMLEEHQAQQEWPDEVEAG